MALRRRRTPEPQQPSRRTTSSASSAAAESAPGRAEQVRLTWRMAREADRRLPLLVFGPALAVLAVLVVVGVLIGHFVSFTVLGIVLAVFAGTTIFGRRATGVMYSAIEGKTGAAGQMLMAMRGDWRVTPAVAFTRNQDMVHRAVGRAGVVLVGEGTSTPQLRQLIVDQKRRVARVAPDTPVHDVLVGDGEGRVPLRQLQRHIAKLPRTVGRRDIPALEQRMKAIGGTNVPLPKGPIPTSGRIPRGKIR